ncbi:MAG: fibrobacter succinogenes major paralogous domain-containing protein [Bacteroidota bacterium]
MRLLLTFLIIVLLSDVAKAQTYTFTGNGRYSQSSNWKDNIKPPSPIPNGSQIIIKPSAGDSCVLDMAQNIGPGAAFIVSEGVRFIIAGEGIIITALPNVTICDQVWMKNNLSVATYRNGDIIPEVKDPFLWELQTTGAWCWFNNDVKNADRGRLYNGYAITDPRGLAPYGWHIASDSEWTQMVKCIDPLTNTTCTGCHQSETAGGALKEAGIAHWQEANVGATNSSGFTAIPASWRSANGMFVLHDLAQSAYFWTASSLDASELFYRTIDHQGTHISRNSTIKKVAYSVRCVKN